MPVHLPGRVSIEEGVEFATGGGRPLLCDIFLPPEYADNRAAVLLIHGGGWATGDRSQLRGYGIQLARYGFVCVAPEYRLSGEATWPAQLHDVKAALRWMRDNADRYGIDTTKICVSGNSAGAHLALMLAGVADGHLEAAAADSRTSTDCAAVVAIYPPTMLRVESADNMIGLLLGGKVSREIENEASPIHYARADFPPTMLVHGNADTVVPVEASLEMYKALADAGASVEMHIYDGVPHAFDSDTMFGRHIADLIALFLDRKVRLTQ